MKKEKPTEQPGFTVENEKKGKEMNCWVGSRYLRDQVSEEM
jgi:hypothetical protein